MSFENCNKYQASITLSKVVNVPKLFDKKVPNGITAVVRPFSHTAGSDFKIIKGEYSLENGLEYASEFINTEIELRVWFVGNATMCAKRIPIDGNEQDKRCRSLWSYKFCYKQTPEKLHDESIKAAKELNLDFGCFDVLVVGNKYYFLEANTASSLDNLRVERFYKENLMKLMQEKFGNKFEELANFERLKKEKYPFPLVEEITD